LSFVNLSLSKPSRTVRERTLQRNPTRFVIHEGGHEPVLAWDVPAAELADKVVDAINIGDEVSVYASTRGGEIAHLVRRNKPNADGAIIVAPNSNAPQALPHSILYYYNIQY
jgi:hypothetical protein